MSKNDLQPATLEDFAYWINERHRIYLVRKGGANKPWSKDPIFQVWKFTNVYRQLDEGTRCLRVLLGAHKESDLVLFNTIWYRLFNRADHALNLGFVKNPKRVQDYITKCFRTNNKIFTGAYMTTGIAFEDKYISYLRAVYEFWDKRKELARLCESSKSLETIFKALLPFFLVGKFVAYEFVCDLRFNLLMDATDINTWANLGPGAVRGLQRLGMEPTLESLISLHNACISKSFLEDHVFDCSWPFELREVEHSLCEFDKYQRIKTGAGRPRSRYNGKSDS